MATSLSAHLHIRLEALLTSDPPLLSGDVKHLVENVVGGRRWTDGTGSGNVDRVYFRDRTATGDGTLGSGATDNYDLLAAGSLTDVFAQAIDADELKAMIIIPTSGSIRIDAPAANFIGLFDDATDLMNVPTGGVAFDWGAAGLDVTTNSKFDITETTSAAAAGYYLLLIVAQ